MTFHARAFRVVRIGYVDGLRELWRVRVVQLIERVEMLFALAIAVTRQRPFLLVLVIVTVGAFAAADIGACLRAGDLL